ncbi:winged helix-turn-helix domain-containing protein [Arsukibacterium indicum]|uniref:Winged helix-turn-helix domain-containing protein n=1 Tax=Arsukibacterium indicum TaxID=2848612 RepID=A0ABS6MPF6_9GAMM|nr:winged helix-turn-helix domain-containing protein [Arsukibacterium indicum]MBV2130687.1 winged helix-turn-helix domain-containing protein [Arsukibacterium indicum]
MEIKPERSLLVGEWHYLAREDKLVKLDQHGQIITTADLDNLGQKVVNYFIVHAGNLVTKDQLLADVWGIRDVSDGRVMRVIRAIRIALDDDTRQPTYIETIPKRGYRFIASVTDIPDKSQAGDKTAEVTSAAAAIKPRKKAFLWAGMLVVSSLLLLSWLFWLKPVADNQSAEVNTIPLWRYKPITSLDGLEFYHSVSPDERYLVFSHAKVGSDLTAVLTLQDLVNHQRVQLTDDNSNSVGAAFSPSGDRIAYHEMLPDRGCEIRMIELEPGKMALKTDTLLTLCTPESVSARISWSPDGRYIIYPSLDAEQKQMVMMMYPVAGGTAEQLTVPPTSSFGDYAGRYSRSGDKIAFIRDAAGAAQIWLLDLTNRATRLLVQIDDAYPGNIDWTQDDRSIIYPSGPTALGIVDVATGVSRELAYTDNHANEIQVGAVSGKIYASVGFFSHTNIKQVNNKRVTETPSENLVFSSNRNESLVEINPLPEGPVAVVSRRSGLPQVWLFYPDGRQQQLTEFSSRERIRSLVFSPDGSKLLLHLNSGIWQLTMDGQLAQIVGKENEIVANPAWSRDGSEVFYAQSRQGRWDIMAAAVNTGFEKRLLATDRELYQQSYIADYNIWRDANSKHLVIEYPNGDTKKLDLGTTADQAFFKLDLRAQGFYFTYLLDGTQYQLRYYDLTNNFINEKVIDDYLYHSRFSISLDETKVYFLEAARADFDIAEISY